MLKHKLVDDEKWITHDHFNHVLAVYQVLPGPEATELCCYFGMLSRGRLGSITAGTGFVLPGFILMFLCSVLYTTFGLKFLPVLAAFTAIQPAVCAMMFRAVHMIAKDALVTNWLLFVGVISTVQTAVGFNFVITLVVAGIFHTLVTVQHPRFKIAAIVSAFLLIAVSFAAVICWYLFVPATTFSAGISFLSAPTFYNIFILGLLAGLLTFGGAYTAIRM